jgi:ribonuclease Z
MFRKIAIVVLVLIVLSGAGLVFRPALTDYSIERQTRAIGKRFQTGLLHDGLLHIITVGTGSPAPDPRRVQSCVAVLADGAFLMFDAGAASAWRADQLRLPMADLNAVFLTHLHSDHIADLPLMADISWRYGRTHELQVYGPEGTEKVVAGFSQAFGPDVGFRYASKENPDVPLEVALPVSHDIKTPGPTRAVLVYRHKNGLAVYAFLVEHPPVWPAFGYRIEYKGRAVVLSGDTRRSENVVRQARGADILIHEAFNKKLVDRMVALGREEAHSDRYAKMTARMVKGVQDYHSSPVDAAQIAAQAGVKTLVLTHIIPPMGGRAARFLVTERLFLQGVADAYHGKVLIAEDGMEWSLDPK